MFQIWYLMEASVVTCAVQFAWELGCSNATFERVAERILSWSTAKRDVYLCPYRFSRTYNINCIKILKLRDLEKFTQLYENLLVGPPLNLEDS